MERPLSHSSPVTVALLVVIASAAIWVAAAVTRSDERLKNIERRLDEGLQAQDRRLERLEGRVFTYYGPDGLKRSGD